MGLFGLAQGVKLGDRAEDQRHGHGDATDARLAVWRLAMGRSRLFGMELMRAAGIDPAKHDEALQTYVVDLAELADASMVEWETAGNQLPNTHDARERFARGIVEPLLGDSPAFKRFIDDLGGVRSTPITR